MFWNKPKVKSYANLVEVSLNSTSLTKATSDLTIHFIAPIQNTNPKGNEEVATSRVQSWRQNDEYFRIHCSIFITGRSCNYQTIEAEQPSF